MTSLGWFDDLRPSQGVGKTAVTLVQLEERVTAAQRQVRPLEPWQEVLRPEVALAVSRRWPMPCEELFEHLAASYPAELAKLIEAPVLASADLTFAAEALGRTTNSDRVRRVLVPLLKHPSAIVREGAIYGLQLHLNPQTREALAAVAASDPSEGVRTAALDALSGG